MRILHDYYRSTAAYRVRIAMNIKQLDYERREVHLVQEGGAQHTDAFKAINPQSLVPVLEDNGITITQSLAIVDYLEEAYPEPALLPKDLPARAFIRSVALTVCCDIHPLNNLRVLKYLKHEQGQTEAEKIAWYHHWLKLGFAALETRLMAYSGRGKCCHGDTPTIADICLIPQIYNAHRFDFDMTAYPTLSAINEYCLQLPAFEQAAPE